MMTVLPTPAPPNSPILPPLRYGSSRSMTLMPVSNICSSVDWSSSVGAGRWIGQRSADLHRPVGKSTGSPSTFMHAAERRGADRHRDRRARVDDRHAALHAVGRLHRDRADAVLAEVLLHLADDVDLLAAAPRPMMCTAL